MVWMIGGHLNNARYKILGNHFPSGLELLFDVPIPMFLIYLLKKNQIAETVKRL